MLGKTHTTVHLVTQVMRITRRIFPDGNFSNANIKYTD